MLGVDLCFYCIEDVRWANVYMKIFRFYGFRFARQSRFLMKRRSYVYIFPIVHERSITFGNLLRNRKNRSNASFLLLLPVCPRPSASVSPSFSLKLGHTFRLCSQLTNAVTWLLTGSLCTAEMAPWAPSACSISSRTDGWALVNVHAKALLRCC